MSGPASSYVPALRFHALTRFYDALLARTLKEDRFNGLLVEQLGARAGWRILDLGCGTGTLTRRLKQAAPEALVVGVDADPWVLDIARHKASAAGLEIEFRQSLAAEADFDAHSFDRVTASLFFHHLLPSQKVRTLERAFAWLRPTGELHVADWGRPHDLAMRLAFVPVQLLDGFANTRDHVRGRFETLLREVGFEAVACTHRERTLFGTLALFRAVRPAR